MKTTYIIGAAILLLLWGRGTKAKQGDTQLQDTLASQRGSDWIGAGGLYAAWDRLSGADLKAPGYGNLAGGAPADPGKVGQIASGLIPAWDGSLPAAVAKAS